MLIFIKNSWVECTACWEFTCSTSRSAGGNISTWSIRPRSLLGQRPVRCNIPSRSGHQYRRTIAPASKPAKDDILARLRRCRASGSARWSCNRKECPIISPNPRWFVHKTARTITCSAVRSGNPAPECVSKDWLCRRKRCRNVRPGFLYHKCTLTENDVSLLEVTDGDLPGEALHHAFVVFLGVGLQIVEEFELIEGLQDDLHVREPAIRDPLLDRGNEPEKTRRHLARRRLLLDFPLQGAGFGGGPFKFHKKLFEIVID